MLGFVAVLWTSHAFAQNAVFGPMASGPMPAPVAAVQANTSGSGPTVASNFVGISVEVGDLVAGYFQGTNGTWNGTASAASFLSLASLLGSNGELRIGGASSDNASATPTSITSGIASGLNTFMGGLGAGWSLRFTLNGLANNSAAAATNAGNLATAIGASKITFQFSNEPIGTALFTVGNYETMWNSYYTAVTGAVASASYAATDDAFFQSQSTIIPSLTPGLSGLATISDHWYPFCAGTYPNPVPAILLTNLASNVVPTFYKGNLWAGTKLQRISEFNSLCSHGQVGMSDRLMAATLGTGLGIALLQATMLGYANYQGLNFHNVFAPTNGPAVYNPFVQQADGGFSPGTIFYAMYLLSKIAGQQLIPSSVGGNGNVAAIATLRAANKANILIVNNDVNNVVSVMPQQSASWTTANVLQVKSAAGQGCGDASLTIGGAAIGEGGTWTGAPFSISNGQSITLGPCEAALVSVQ